MDIILLVLHVFLSLGIISLVLLQKGSGASAGAAFGGGGGGGGAGSIFGASGSSNFLSKTTAIFATAFFINSMVLAYLASNRDVTVDSVMDALTAPAIEMPAPEMPAPALNVPPADSSGVPAVDDVPPPAGE